MSGDHLGQFLEAQRELLTSADLPKQIAAIAAVGSLPVDELADQLRSAIQSPGDWLLVNAAVGAAFSSENEWAINIILESCWHANDPRLCDRVNDELREICNSQWLRGTEWLETTPIVFLRKRAVFDDAAGLAAKRIADWLGTSASS